MESPYSPRDVTVIICAFTMARWNDLVEAVDSVKKQSSLPGQVIIVIDHNPEMLQQVHEQIAGVVAVENRGSQGAGESRNSGATAACTPLLAFLDDDAVATPDWIEALCAGFSTTQVIGVGGFIEPLWTGSRPRWFPREFDWVIGGTYEGLPTVTTPVRNLWSGNLCVRTDVFNAVNGFRSGFGKVGGRSNPEDTEFCIRALQQWPGGQWLFKPDAKIWHKVPKNRMSWRYFIRRCYYEGTGKAGLGNLVGAQESTQTERNYVRKTLPKGVLRGLGDTILRADIGGVARSTAIVVGFAVTAIGYVVGLLELRFSK